MKRAMITVRQGDITLKVSADIIATTFISATLAHIGGNQPAAANQDGVPPLGQPWPGEGGCNAGLVRGLNGSRDYYLIVPAGQQAEFKAEFGGYGTNTASASSPSDGLANTIALLDEGADHPAARCAAEYTADGHEDAYLPARRELQVAEANVPELFSKGYHWSSTQYSAYYAFTMDFEGGWQGYDDKIYERLVRPVRRKFL